MDVISFLHLIDINIPILKVSKLRVKTHQKAYKGQDRDSNAAPRFQTKSSINYIIGCEIQVSVVSVGIPLVWLSLFHSLLVYSLFRDMQGIRGGVSAG